MMQCMWREKSESDQRKNSIYAPLRLKGDPFGEKYNREVKLC